MKINELIVVISLTAFFGASYARPKCLFKPKNVKPQCAKLISSGLTNSEKQKIVNKHNSLRRSTGAKNMALLSWDNELAASAQQWANYCNYKHDPCRDVGRYKVGQNLNRWGSTREVKNWDVERPVQSWYDEIKFFNKKDISKYKYDPKYGHYSQVVWAETTKIGCGVVRYKDGKLNRQFLVCNYGPTGNVEAKPMYKT
ncbi:venom allergen 5-like [Trichogramma pretiosum]|uniref:venom allergen 5-like n=1 Tax=Trichogramma pretiosum TaxID=7493 RepID=UPI0006C9CA86|nr:venom allergen 5-like [Trichogramma pretiosum]